MYKCFNYVEKYLESLHIKHSKDSNPIRIKIVKIYISFWRVIDFKKLSSTMPQAINFTRIYNPSKSTTQVIQHIKRVHGFVTDTLDKMFLMKISFVPIMRVCLRARARACALHNLDSEFTLMISHF